jgi:20S proteasome alpha/beta subunit
MSSQNDLTPFFGAATVGITFNNGVVIGAERSSPLLIISSLVVPV